MKTYEFPCRSDLSPEEWLEAASAGLFRFYESKLLRKRNETFGQSPEASVETHVNGAPAERALAKLLDRYWHGKGILRGPDVSARIQVRHRVQAKASLILHETDRDDEEFFLVTGLPPYYTVWGWVPGVIGKDKRKYWREAGPLDPADPKSPALRWACFLVPQSDLYRTYPMVIPAKPPGTSPGCPEEP